jgi:hypothetical protein
MQLYTKAALASRRLCASGTASVCVCPSYAPRRASLVRAHDNTGDAAEAPARVTNEQVLEALAGLTTSVHGLRTEMKTGMKRIEGMSKDMKRIEGMVGASLEYNIQQRRGIAPGLTLINGLHIAGCLVAPDGAERAGQTLALAQHLSNVLTEVRTPC